jgi:hypothetical protein
MFTNKQLLALYDPSGRTGTTGNGLGRELKRAGFQQACGGKPLKLKDGSQDRYYIIRNINEWTKASTGGVIAHIEQYLMREEKAKKF